MVSGSGLCAKVLAVNARHHMLGQLSSILAKESLNGRRVVAVRAEEIFVSGGLVRQKMKYLGQSTSPIHTSAIQFPGVLAVVRGERGLAPASRVFQASNSWIGVKYMHSDISAVPELADPQAKQALNALLATNWSKIEKEVHFKVEAAIAKGGADSEVLSTVWSSARASESFADTLECLRMDLDELSGSDGESVGKLPDTLIRAIESAFSKYSTYLESIGEDEDFLKKKVENDLGSILVQIKQRCSGLDPKWGRITLLGTSGLSGSYIERRHTPS